MKYLKAAFNAIDGVAKFIWAVLIIGLVVMFITGNATVSCKAPSWINNNYSCQGFVSIPNR